MVVVEGIILAASVLATAGRLAGGTSAGEVRAAEVKVVEAVVAAEGALRAVPRGANALRSTRILTIRGRLTLSRRRR